MVEAEAPCFFVGLRINSWPEVSKTITILIDLCQKKVIPEERRMLNSRRYVVSCIQSQPARRIHRELYPQLVVRRPDCWAANAIQ